MWGDARIGLIKSSPENTYPKTCSVFPSAQSTSFLISTLNPLLGVMKVCSGSRFSPWRASWQVPVCSWQYKRGDLDTEMGTKKKPKECLRLPQVRRAVWDTCFCTPLGGTNPADILTWTSSTHSVGQHISVADYHPVWGILLQQPSELTEVKCQSVSCSVMSDPL